MKLSMIFLGIGLAGLSMASQCGDDNQPQAGQQPQVKAPSQHGLPDDHGKGPAAGSGAGSGQLSVDDLKQHGAAKRPEWIQSSNPWQSVSYPRT